MKKLLIGSLLALALAIVPLTLLAENEVIIIDESGTPNLAEGYGVITGVHVWDMYAGAVATGPLKIVCGRDGDRIFNIYVTEPDPRSLEPGYTTLPEEYYSWITIGDNDVPAEAGEMVSVPITITIPSDMLYTNRHDAFALFVKDITQADLTQIAYKSVWFITTDSMPVRRIIGGINPIWVAGIAGISGLGCVIYLMKDRRKHAQA